MSAIKNAIKSAFISNSEDLSAIWTVLSEEERDEAFEQIKYRMQDNSDLVYNIASADLQDRFIRTEAKEKWFLGDSVHLKLFRDKDLISVSFTKSHDDVVFAEMHVKFVGCFEIVNEYTDKFTRRQIKTVTILGFTEATLSIIREIIKSSSKKG